MTLSSQAILLKEAKPDLAHGREHRNGVPELVQGDLGDYRDRGRVKKIDHHLANEGDTEQHAAILVDDCFDATDVVVGL